MQPTYLPWVGYFDLMDRVDRFVLLDDVQFEKQSWQQRNRVKTPKGLEWLTIPVVRGHLHKTIAETELSEPSFWKKQLRTIECNYATAPFYREHIDDLRACYAGSASTGSLVSVTTGLIAWLAERFGISTATVRSSQLAVDGARSERLVRICQSFQADTYLSPPGSAGYLLGDLPLFAAAGIEVLFHNYAPVEYQQLFPPFQPYAAALDLLLNEGPRSLEVIRAGRRPALRPDELPA